MAQLSPPKRFIRKLLSSKIFLFAAIFILIFLIVGLGRESYRKYQLTKEIDKLKSEVNQLEGKNQQLAGLMEYFKEDSYLEKEARLKLNLKKPDEKVVILSESAEGGFVDQESNGEFEVVWSGATGQQNSPANDLSENSDIQTNNWWKWWEYFFQNQ